MRTIEKDDHDILKLHDDQYIIDQSCLRLFDQNDTDKTLKYCRQELQNNFLPFISNITSAIYVMNTIHLEESCRVISQ